jgi:hypothetical protein
MAKGKDHKAYEYGRKTFFASTVKSNIRLNGSGSNVIGRIWGTIFMW